MTARHILTVTSVHRRIFGLPRLVWIVRCATCSWRREFADSHTASVFTKEHTMKGRA